MTQYLNLKQSSEEKVKNREVRSTVINLTEEQEVKGAVKEE
jgi:hypothetical protein